MSCIHSSSVPEATLNKKMFLQELHSASKALLVSSPLEVKVGRQEEQRLFGVYSIALEPCQLGLCLAELIGCCQRQVKDSFFVCLFISNSFSLAFPPVWMVF